MGRGDNFLMAHPRIQVQHTRDIFRILHSEIDHVVQPILAQTVPVLNRYGHCIFLAAKQTIQFKFDFDFFPRLKIAEFGVFQTRVGSENIHADAVPNQNADYRV